MNFTGMVCSCHGTLADCVELAPGPRTARRVLKTLIHAMRVTQGDAHRAAAGALGALPLSVQGPDPDQGSCGTIPVVRYDRLLRQAGLNDDRIPGEDFQGGVPFDLDMLTERMVEEMGVDRHMEETIRVVDQQALTGREFRRFLFERGVAQATVDSLSKGQADIVISSGPHLGAFNAGISLPELIDFTASLAAVCVAGRYWQDSYGIN